MLKRLPIAPGAGPPPPTQSREGALQRHLKALGRAGLLVTVSAFAAQAQLAAPTTPSEDRATGFATITGIGSVPLSPQIDLVVATTERSTVDVWLLGPDVGHRRPLEPGSLRPLRRSGDGPGLHPRGTALLGRSARLVRHLRDVR